MLTKTKKIQINKGYLGFLRDLRIKKGYSQNALAVLLGIGVSSYRCIEQDTKGINLKLLNNIRMKFNLSWQDLGCLIEREVK